MLKEERHFSVVNSLSDRAWHPYVSRLWKAGRLFSLLPNASPERDSQWDTGLGPTLPLAEGWPLPPSICSYSIRVSAVDQSDDYLPTSFQVVERSVRQSSGKFQSGDSEWSQLSQVLPKRIHDSGVDGFAQKSKAEIKPRWVQRRPKYK